VIASEEVEQNAFAHWLQLLENHMDEFTFLNPEGNVTEFVPKPEAVSSESGDEGCRSDAD
jgi:hypothetical protein